MNSKKTIWISWEIHRRSSELANYFKIDKYFFVSNLNRFVKHPYFIIKTFLILMKVRPNILVIQNPSIVLAVFVCFLKKLKIFSYKLIVDSHNEGVKPFYKKFNYFLFIYSFIHKTADLNIVTNEKLGNIVHYNGGKHFVLPDRLPFVENVNRINLKGKFNYLFICTFAKDEPVANFLIASSRLDNSDCVYITGDYKKWKNDIYNLNTNIIFTGYLSDNDYWNYLYSVDCVIDLTMIEDCIVCGAYEALSLGKPMLLTDSEVLRSTFSMGAIFTNNDTHSLEKNLAIIKQQIDALRSETEQYRSIFQQQWERKALEFKNKLLSL